MPRPDVRVVVLYEDEVHDSFLRKLVKHLRIEPVRFQKCGDSTGVLQRVGGEVDALRAQKHQRNLALVICIDADKKVRQSHGPLRAAMPRMCAEVGVLAPSGCRDRALRPPRPLRARRGSMARAGFGTNRG